MYRDFSPIISQLKNEQILPVPKVRITLSPLFQYHVLPLELMFSTLLFVVRLKSILKTIWSHLRSQTFFYNNWSHIEDSERRNWSPLCLHLWDASTDKHYVISGPSCVRPEGNLKTSLRAGVTSERSKSFQYNGKSSVWAARHGQKRFWDLSQQPLGRFIRSLSDRVVSSLLSSIGSNARVTCKNEEVLVF